MAEPFLEECLLITAEKLALLHVTLEYVPFSAAGIMGHTWFCSFKILSGIALLGTAPHTAGLVRNTAEVSCISCIQPATLPAKNNAWSHFVPRAQRAGSLSPFPELLVRDLL